jgi:hypothetical protein
MTRNFWISTLLAFALGVAGGTLPSEAAEFRCANGDLVRRIEVIGTDTPQDASCEVRYWRNAARADASQSLWRSDRDPEYCVARARELIARLESGGWRCASREAATPAAEPAAGPLAEEPPLAHVPVKLAPAPELGSPDVVASKPISPAASPAAPFQR